MLGLLRLRTKFHNAYNKGNALKTNVLFLELTMNKLFIMTVIGKQSAIFFWDLRDCEISHQNSHLRHGESPSTQ